MTAAAAASSLRAIFLSHSSIFAVFSGAWSKSRHFILHRVCKSTGNMFAKIITLSAAICAVNVSIFFLDGTFFDDPLGWLIP